MASEVLDPLKEWETGWGLGKTNKTRVRLNKCDEFITFVITTKTDTKTKTRTED
jgi:hypothetical protein